jgi:signal transduction histidine kinase
MQTSYDNLLADIEKVQRIPIVTSMLEVICRTTGMGFAAIARVTEDKWIACSVRDEVAFGLEPGGELKIETTICNEIRDSRQAVIIDHVAEDDMYRAHHTPRIYGLQSYISMPIILKTGEFFGTLCAIDSRPAELKNPKVIGMFNLFVDLISFHLQNLDLVDKSASVMMEMNNDLNNFKDENRQYQYISNHNLQEPLRKVRLFSNMLITALDTNDAEKAKEMAVRINGNAQRVSMMIKDISQYSELSHTDEAFDKVDLNLIVADVSAHLKSQFQSKDIIFNIDTLPTIQALPIQIEQLFYHLINNAIKFSKKDVPLIIGISANKLNDKQFEIHIEDNGIGIEKSQLGKIFDIFSTLSNDQTTQGFGVGLAYCRKIVRNHGGSITAQSEPGQGSTFSIIFPVK